MYFLQVVSVISLAVTVWSACHMVSRDNLSDDGNDDDHCTHPEFPDYRLSVGTFITTSDCLNISCSKDAVRVCQFGWALADIIGVPENCKKVRVGDCGVKFVQVADEEKLCFEGKDLEYNLFH